MRRGLSIRRSHMTRDTSIAQTILYLPSIITSTLRGLCLIESTTTETAFFFLAEHNILHHTTRPLIVHIPSQVPWHAKEVRVLNESSDFDGIKKRSIDGDHSLTLE